MRSDDDLAEELGEDFVRSALSGEDEHANTYEEPVAEELGGPFVTSAGATELADGEDETNPADGTREPFPTT